MSKASAVAQAQTDAAIVAGYVASIRAQKATTEAALVAAGVDPRAFRALCVLSNFDRQVSDATLGVDVADLARSNCPDESTALAAARSALGLGDMNSSAPGSYSERDQLVDLMTGAYWSNIYAGNRGPR